MGLYTINYELINDSPSTLLNLVFKVTVSYKFDNTYNLVTGDKFGVTFSSDKLTKFAFYFDNSLSTNIESLSKLVESDNIENFEGEFDPIYVKVPTSIEEVKIIANEFASSDNISSSDFKGSTVCLIDFEDFFTQCNDITDFYMTNEGITTNELVINDSTDLNNIYAHLVWEHDDYHNEKNLFDKTLSYTITCQESWLGELTLPKIVSADMRSYDYKLPGLTLKNHIEKVYKDTNISQETINFQIIANKVGIFSSKIRTLQITVVYDRPIEIIDIWTSSDSNNYSDPTAPTSIRVNRTYTTLNDNGDKFWDDSGDGFTELRVMWKVNSKYNLKKFKVKAYTYLGPIAANMSSAIFRLGTETDISDNINMSGVGSNGLVFGYSYPVLLNRSFLEGFIKTGKIEEGYETEDVVSDNITRWVAFRVTAIDNNDNVSPTVESAVIKIERRPMIRYYHIKDKDIGDYPYNYESGFNIDLCNNINKGNTLSNSEISWGIDRVTLAEWLGINIDKNNKSFKELLKEYQKQFWKNCLETYERTKNILSPVKFELDLIYKTDYYFYIEDNTIKLGKSDPIATTSVIGGTEYVTYTPKYEINIDNVDKDLIDWILSLDHQHHKSIDKDEFVFFEKSGSNDIIKQIIKSSILTKFLKIDKNGAKYYEVKSEYDDLANRIDTIFNTANYTYLKRMLRQVLDTGYFTYRLHQYELLPSIYLNKLPTYWECPKCRQTFVTARVNSDDVLYVYENHEDGGIKEYRSVGSVSALDNVDKYFNLLRSARREYKCPHCDYVPKDYEVNLVPAWLSNLLKSRTGIDINIPLPKLIGHTTVVSDSDSYKVSNADLFDYNNNLDRIITAMFYKGQGDSEKLYLLMQALISGNFNTDSVKSILSLEGTSDDCASNPGIDNFKELIDYSKSNSYIRQARDYYEAECTTCGHTLYLDILYKDGDYIKCPYCMSANIRTKIKDPNNNNMLLIKAYQGIEETSKSYVSDADYFNLYHKAGTQDLDIMAHYAPTGNINMIEPSSTADTEVINLSRVKSSGVNISFKYNKKYGEMNSFYIIMGIYDDDYNWNTSVEFNNSTYYETVNIIPNEYNNFCRIVSSDIYNAPSRGSFSNNSVSNYSCIESDNDIVISFNFNLYEAYGSEIEEYLNEPDKLCNINIQIRPSYYNSNINQYFYGKSRIYKKHDSDNFDVLPTDYGNTEYTCCDSNLITIKRDVTLHPYVDMICPNPNSTNIYDSTPVIDGMYTIDEESGDIISPYKGNYHWFGDKDSTIISKVYVDTDSSENVQLTGIKLFNSSSENAKFPVPQSEGNLVYNGNCINNIHDYHDPTENTNPKYHKYNYNVSNNPTTDGDISSSEFYKNNGWILGKGTTEDDIGYKYAISGDYRIEFDNFSTNNVSRLELIVPYILRKGSKVIITAYVKSDNNEYILATKSIDKYLDKYDYNNKNAVPDYIYSIIGDANNYPVIGDYSGENNKLGSVKFCSLTINSDTKYTVINGNTVAYNPISMITDHIYLRLECDSKLEYSTSNLCITGRDEGIEPTSFCDYSIGTTTVTKKSDIKLSDYNSYIKSVICNGITESKLGSIFSGISITIGGKILVNEWRISRLNNSPEGTYIYFKPGDLYVDKWRRTDVYIEASEVFTDTYNSIVSGINNTVSTFINNLVTDRFITLRDIDEYIKNLNSRLFSISTTNPGILTNAGIKNIISRVISNMTTTFQNNTGISRGVSYTNGIVNNINTNTNMLVTPNKSYYVDEYCININRYNDGDFITRAKYEGLNASDTSPKMYYNRTKLTDVSKEIINYIDDVFKDITDSLQNIFSDLFSRDSIRDIFVSALKNLNSSRQSVIVTICNKINETIRNYFINKFMKLEFSVIGGVNPSNTLEVSSTVKSKFKDMYGYIKLTSSTGNIQNSYTIDHDAAVVKLYNVPLSYINALYVNNIRIQMSYNVDNPYWDSFVFGYPTSNGSEPSSPVHLDNTNIQNIDISGFYSVSDRGSNLKYYDYNVGYYGQYTDRTVIRDWSGVINFFEDGLKVIDRSNTNPFYNYRITSLYYNIGKVIYDCVYRTKSRPYRYIYNESNGYPEDCIFAIPESYTEVFNDDSTQVVKYKHIISDNELITGNKLLEYKAIYRPTDNGNANKYGLNTDNIVICQGKLFRGNASDSRFPRSTGNSKYNFRTTIRVTPRDYGIQSYRSISNNVSNSYKPEDTSRDNSWTVEYLISSFYKTLKVNYSVLICNKSYATINDIKGSINISNNGAISFNGISNGEYVRIISNRTKTFEYGSTEYNNFLNNGYYDIDIFENNIGIKTDSKDDEYLIFFIVNVSGNRWYKREAIRAKSSNSEYYKYYSTVTGSGNSAIYNTQPVLNNVSDAYKNWWMRFDHAGVSGYYSTNGNDTPTGYNIEDTNSGHNISVISIVDINNTMLINTDPENPAHNSNVVDYSEYIYKYDTEFEIEDGYYGYQITNVNPGYVYDDKHYLTPLIKWEEYPSGTGNWVYRIHNSTNDNRINNGDVCFVDNSARGGVFSYYIYYGNTQLNNFSDDGYFNRYFPKYFRKLDYFYVITQQSGQSINLITNRVEDSGIEFNKNNPLYITMKFVGDKFIPDIIHTKVGCRFAGNNNNTVLANSEDYTDPVHIYNYKLSEDPSGMESGLYSQYIQEKGNLTNSVPYKCEYCDRLYRVKDGSVDYIYEDEYDSANDTTITNQFNYHKFNTVRKEFIASTVDNETLAQIYDNNYDLNNEFDNSYKSYAHINTDGTISYRCIECGRVLKPTYEIVDGNLVGDYSYSLNGEYMYARAIEAFNGYFGNHTPFAINFMRSNYITANKLINNILHNYFKSVKDLKNISQFGELSGLLSHMDIPSQSPIGYYMQYYGMKYSDGPSEFTEKIENNYYDFSNNILVVRQNGCNERSVSVDYDINIEEITDNDNELNYEFLGHRTPINIEFSISGIGDTTFDPKLEYGFRYNEELLEFYTEQEDEEFIESGYISYNSVSNEYKMILKFKDTAFIDYNPDDSLSMKIEYDSLLDTFTGDDTAIRERLYDYTIANYNNNYHGNIEDDYYKDLTKSIVIGNSRARRKVTIDHIDSTYKFMYPWNRIPTSLDDTGLSPDLDQKYNSNSELFMHKNTEDFDSVTSSFIRIFKILYKRDVEWDTYKAEEHDKKFPPSNN